MKKTVLILLLLASTSMAQAVVNLKNGNFYVEYVDFEVTPTLRLNRSYNSNALTTGWFGVGWGGALETRLTVLPDGTVAVNEHGNAHTTVYGEPDEKAIAHAATKIMRAITSKQTLDAQKTEALIAKLKSDASYRLKMATKYSVKGEDIPVGTSLVGVEFANVMDKFTELSDLDFFVMGGDEAVQLKREYKTLRKEKCGQLKRTKEGFERSLCSDKVFGRKDFFDSQGRLLRREDQNASISLKYGAAGRLETISNSEGRSIRLEWNTNGRVIRATTDSPHKHLSFVDYSYNDKNELIRSTNKNANDYQYRYDERHNLTTIVYFDDKKREMTYHGNGAIASDKKKDGALSLFAYDTVENGDKNVTYSTQKPGQPVQLRQELRYNSKGNLLRNSKGSGANRVVFEYEYHPTLGTITRTNDNGKECRYEYNASAQVIRESCPTEQIEVVYDYDKSTEISRISIGRSHPLGPFFDAWVSKTAKTIDINMGFDEQGRMSTIKLDGTPVYSQVDYKRDPPRAKLINDRPNLDGSGSNLYSFVIPMAVGKILDHTANGTFIETGFDLVE
jgi:YD repeat-containing protein